MSNEQPQIHRALASAGVDLAHALTRRAFADGELTLAQSVHQCRAPPAVPLPGDRRRPLRQRLRCTPSSRAEPAALAAAGIRSVSRIGDALAPGAIVHAVYSGHRFARELDADPAVARPSARRAARETQLSSCTALPPRRAGLEPTLPSAWYRDARCSRSRRNASSAANGCASLARRSWPRRGHSACSMCAARASFWCATATATLRAFYNVCRHRGARLCRDSGHPAAARGRRGRRPHHLSLSPVDLRPRRTAARRAAPQWRARTSTRRSSASTRWAVACWGGFVFLHLTPAQAVPLPQQLGAVTERIARYPLARAAHRPHHPLPGRRQLEGAVRELQRVLPLRRRASGAVRGRAGVPRARRRQPRLGARHSASPRRLHVHGIGHHTAACRFRP